MTQQNNALVGNRYRLLEEFGQGGMGTVYKGLDTQTNTPVAIKLLKAERVASDPEILERFQREGEALRELNHPNIVKMLATVKEHDRHYLIMEFVAGGDLQKMLKQEGKLPLDRLLAIAIQIADALTRAHFLKIVHRDLKPANVLIAEDGTPHLTDFGVAYFVTKDRVTGPGVTIGTLDYLPPEALYDGFADARVDIWSFGVMLFEMLTGQKPFAGESLAQIITSILTKPILDLEDLSSDAPIELIDLIYRMLEKDRDARIHSIRIVGAELEAIMQGAALLVSPNWLDGGLAAHQQETRPITLPVRVTAPKHNLPAQTTSFVGRETELAELTRLVDDPDTRLITILAPGGMGKSRLALELGERLVKRRKSTMRSTVTTFNGVWFVELASLSTSENIPHAIAEAMGYQFQPDERIPKQQIIDYLSNKQILLVMDNYEHLLDGAGLLTEILRASPQVQILVTSRIRLRQSGETIFNLEGMGFPQWESPEDAMEYMAVKLFMQSARRVLPGFELQEDDLAHVAHICRMVNGIPLGILLAAAWLEMLPLAEIVGEMSRDLDFLETELTDIPERQRGIRSVFDYSWNLLTEAEREIFMKVSVFRGGMTRAAAQEVTGASLRQLMALVNKSLLRRDANTGRFHIHEMLLQYAEERLHEAGDMAAVRTAHCHYYAAALHQREADLKSRGQMAVLDDIATDFENIHAAWDWALAQRDYEAIEQALVSIREYCGLRGGPVMMDLFFQPAREQLAPQPGEAPHAVWGRSLACYTIPVDYKRALPTLEEALKIARQQNNQRDIAYCLYMQAEAYSARAEASGDHQNFVLAVQLGEESRTLFRQLGDGYFAAMVSTALAYYCILLGRLEQAIINAKDAVEQYRAIGLTSGLAGSLFMWAMADFVLYGSSRSHEQMLYEAYQYAQDVNYQRSIVDIGHAVAMIALLKGDFTMTRNYLVEVEKVAIDSHYIVGKNSVLAIWGQLALLEEDYATARQYFEQTQEIIPPLDALFVASGLALMACIDGDFQKARQFYEVVRQLPYEFPRMMVACLLIEVLALAPEDSVARQTRAAELVGLIAAQSVYLRGGYDKWPVYSHVQDQLKIDLGEDVYAAALRRGAQLDLVMTASQVLGR